MSTVKTAWLPIQGPEYGKGYSFEDVIFKMRQYAGSHPRIMMSLGWWQLCGMEPYSPPDIFINYSTSSCMCFSTMGLELHLLSSNIITIGY
jgi:hypothetical protein